MDNDNERIKKRVETYKYLRQEHRQALELRFKGLSYADIAKELNRPVSTVKWWFKKGGKLYKAFKEFQVEELNRIRNGAIELLRGASTKAASTLIDLLDAEQDSTRLRAAVEILNRLGIKVEVGAGEFKRKYGGTTIIVTRGEYKGGDKATLSKEKIEVREAHREGKYVGKLPTLLVDRKRERLNVEKLKE